MGKRGGNIISFPYTGSSIVQITGISRRGEIQGAVRGYGIDGLSDDTILEYRFCKVNYIIDNDTAAGSTQIEDILSKLSLTHPLAVAKNN